MKSWIKLFSFLRYNRCDSCGLTKDRVAVTEFFAESGFIQCQKCIKKLGVDTHS
jgi:hypothetical protein